VRALWIEDHQLIGDSLEMLLQVVMPEITLDKALDLATASRLIQTFQYELILLDWWLGSTDGESAINTLRARETPPPIVVVSGDERESIKTRALELGATAYVLKSASPAELVRVMRQTLQIPPADRQPSAGPRAAPRHLPEHSRERDFQAVFPELTARQAEVFQELVRGLSDKQIARELGISDTTVKSHVRAILQIVGVHKRGEAAFEARARGVDQR
jgi:two-component system nitrate/nitrite response regulator NarL